MINLPKYYLLQCKRGVKFEDKKIELSQYLIRYFNPSILLSNIRFR